MQFKQYTKAYCNYSMQFLQWNIIAALESITLESLYKHLNKVQNYLFAHLTGLPGGWDLETMIKKYNKTANVIAELQKKSDNFLYCYVFQL